MARTLDSRSPLHAAPSVDTPVAPRRVMYVCHHARLSGGEISLLNLLRRIDRTRFKPIVLSGSDGPLLDKLSEIGVQTIVLPLAPTVADTRKDSLGTSSIARFGAAWQVVKYIWRLRRTIRRQDVDLVHTNTLKAAVLGGIAARFAGKTTVWHVRDRIDEDYLPRKAVKVFRLLSRLIPSQVWTNSQATAQTIAPNASANAVPRVIYEGVPEVRDVPPPDLSRAGTKTIGIVGRLAPWKGQHVFIEAASKLVERTAGLRFWIIGSAMFGESDYEGRLRDQIRTSGLSDQVELLGHRDDVPDLLTQLDVFVHASTTGEPFGKVIVEAMAAARPVVASDGGGVPEIVVDGRTGLLTPMGDADALADALETLLCDPELSRRMALTGQRRVAEQFLSEHTTRRVESLYDELLAM